MVVAFTDAVQENRPYIRFLDVAALLGKVTISCSCGRRR